MEPVRIQFSLPPPVHLVVATPLMNNSWINKDKFWLRLKHDTWDKRSDTCSLFPSRSGTRGQAAAATKGGRKREASPPAVRTRGGQKSEEPPSKRAKRWNTSHILIFFSALQIRVSFVVGGRGASAFSYCAHKSVSASLTVGYWKALVSITHSAVIAECKPEDLCRNPPWNTFYCATPIWFGSSFLGLFSNARWVRVFQANQRPNVQLSDKKVNWRWPEWCLKQFPFHRYHCYTFSVVDALNSLWLIIVNFVITHSVNERRCFTPVFLRFRFYTLTLTGMIFFFNNSSKAQKNLLFMDWIFLKTWHGADTDLFLTVEGVTVMNCTALEKPVTVHTTVVDICPICPFKDICFWIKPKWNSASFLSLHSTGKQDELQKRF